MLDDSSAEVKKLEAIANQTDFSAKSWQLVDFKTMTPDVFSNKANQSYKVWAKKVKAFTKAKLTGFRTALDWAEREPTVVDRTQRDAQNWRPM